MPHLDDISGWLRERLPRLLDEHQVPGAAIGVYANSEVTDQAAGVLSLDTGVEATADSVFQIGSITKTWTATLIMQLADEGLLDIDEKVRTYLPEFRVADETASAEITIRQLLCHTAGFEGDIFTDTGNGDDCVEKYVRALGTVPQLFPPGEMFSYNNAGFCVLGRVIEVLRGKPFDACLRERLFTPLGLTHAATDAGTAILHRAAVGHLQLTPEARQEPAPVWALPRSGASAGSMLSMRPRDLLAFARMHMTRGAAADGTRLLSEASVRAMREQQVTLPPIGFLGTGWGLGWDMFGWPGGAVIGHDGSTIGQSAFLRMVPDQDVAIALLANGGNPVAVYHEIFGYLLRELAGVELPPPPQPPANPERIDASRYAGSYVSDMAEYIVSQDPDGRIWLETVPRGLAVELGELAERSELVRLDGDTLIPVEAKRGIRAPQVFIGDDGSGRALYIHSGRAARRASVR
jgi:CubicO group peptidase (beta-lactamase class C family)